MKNYLKDLEVTSKSMVFPTSQGGGYNYLHSSYGVPPTSPKPNKSRPLYSSQLEDKSSNGKKGLLMEARSARVEEDERIAQLYDKGAAKQ